MDKELTPKQGQSIDSTAWNNTIKKFLSLREDFPTLNQLSLQLPYGLEQKSWDDFLWSDVTKNNGKKLVYEPCTITDKSGFKNPHIYPLVLQHKIVRSGRKVIALEQSFSTVASKIVVSKPGRRTTRDEVLFDPKQDISKKNGYYYRWNQTGDLIRISKLIGTADINQIKRQGFSIVKECERFIFMYCQG